MLECRNRGALMKGRTLSHYTVLDHLGDGGMGVVYHGFDTRLNRPVALKFLAPELSQDPAAKEQFMREARAASALDHSNICTIYDIDETPEGQIFLAMAYVDGETLKDTIARGPLRIDDILDIGADRAGTRQGSRSRYRSSRHQAGQRHENGRSAREDRGLRHCQARWRMPH